MLGNARVEILAFTKLRVLKVLLKIYALSLGRIAGAT